MFRIVFIFLCLFTVSLSHAQVITYRGIGESIDQYYTELLQTILNQVKDKHYKVQRLKDDIPHRRSFESMEAGKSIDVVIGYATQERINQYNAIPLPITKGLNGWRIALLHKDNKDLLQHVNSLQQLREFTPGLYHTWTDNKIFRANGIKTTKGTNYNGLFHMLTQKRYDYFPQPIIEVSREAEKYTHKLVIDPHIIITYPVCFYFYVSSNNNKLANDITAGFEKIIANGKFEAIFQKHHGGIVNTFLNEKRHILHLHNPLLPKGVPIERKELWIQQ